MIKNVYCKRCGHKVKRETTKGLRKEYPYYCPCCDENMYRFETVKHRFEVKRMTKKDAENIAQDFFKRCNPEMWDGNGEQPMSVDERIYEVPLSDYTRLDLGIAEDDNGWYHLCEIVDLEANEVIEIHSGDSIDSVEDMVDTILSLDGIVKR